MQKNYGNKVLPVQISDTKTMDNKADVICLFHRKGYCQNRYISQQNRRFMFKSISVLTIVFLIMLGCESPQKDTRLMAVDPDYSGIHFKNIISENDSINVVDFQYCYNGGGVGIGDLNSDGLPDVILGGNQVPTRIYLNAGNLKFTDITEKIGQEINSWVTGVSVVDINADGLVDFYLNVGGSNCQNNCYNLLFINQGNDETGIPKFIEQAAEYGLNDGNYSQQTAFFDYDGDGDLDAYILHNGNSGFDKNNPVPKQYMPKHLKDYLLKNDFKEALGHPYFRDVSEESKIDQGGYGLGIGINDFNNDGLVDIYIANDFITEDLLYIQQRHKDSLQPWFEERSKDYLGHETFNAMGVDFADINNDDLPDVLVVDMLPENYERQKKMLGNMNYEKYLLALRNGYSAQFVHNTLQLHNGFNGEDVIRASEVGFLSGISSTDWSWAPLVIDLDNDADKDIYITNGYVKDVTDLDYINYSSQNNMFGTTEERLQKQKEFTKQLDSIYLPNYIYENEGSLQFKDVSTTWVSASPSFSNGVAYADFDQDGDLDLIINNINEEATLLENKTSDEKEKHYLRINLKGSPENPESIGAKVTLWNNGVAQQHFQSVIRGYLSSVESVVHFGVADNTVDSLLITWPNGNSTRMNQIPANQILELSINDSKTESQGIMRPSKSFFKTDHLLIDHTHKENPFNEYAIQPLLMRQHSQYGPCIAIANIDGKPGDELFIGGSNGEAGSLWFQNREGKYEIRQELETNYEDTDAVFVDIDGDGDLDLYVSSGSSEFGKTSENYVDRVYLNDGKGSLLRAKAFLQESQDSHQLVRPADIDKDGDMDFFIGSRIVPGNYPNKPSSKILLNENGTLKEKSFPAIDSLGMVTDAEWVDINADGWQDLVVVGEWMPITLIKNISGNLNTMTTSFIDGQNNEINSTGWWNGIAKGDFDKDGDIDFLIGNQGLNGFFNPSQEQPLYVYKGDFDDNGSPDPVLGKYFTMEEGAKLLPLHARDNIVNQLPNLKRKYLRYENFNREDFQGLMNIQNLEEETLYAKIFASSYVENLGGNRFKISPLDMQCQVAPINDFLVEDFNKDGYLDVLVVGNDFSSESIYGRMDALTGLYLLGSKQGFKVIGSASSGFYVPGQSHHIKSGSDKDGETFILVTQNNARVKSFRY